MLVRDLRIDWDLELTVVGEEMELVARLLLSGIGIIAAAVSGALAATRKDFDVVGILTLAVVTALGGGMTRDVIIGALPAAALVDLWMLGLAVASAAVVILVVNKEDRLRRPLLVFDAIGLGMFVVDGALKALAFGLHPIAAALVGTITGVGGGIVRDVLSNEVPIVFRKRSRLYVVPAFLGGLMIVVMAQDGVGIVGMMVTAVAVAAVRIVSLWLGWHLPGGRNSSR